MRLITDFIDPHEARTFSTYLSSQRIAHQVERSTNTDWGSSEYGITRFQLWIQDEDDMEAAAAALNRFRTDPTAQEWQAATSEAAPPRSKTPQRAPSQRSMWGTTGMVTRIMLMTCSLLFLYSIFSRPPYQRVTEGTPTIALFAPSLFDVLMYDFPKTYERLQRFVALYGTEGLNNPALLSPEGRALLKQYQTTPYWQGLYEVVLQQLRREPPSPPAPLFEKIRQGEVWRLLTPCFLHFDFLHIFFNMFWLLFLGPKIESRVSVWGYLFLVVASGVVSNSAQYLMSGSNFIGFSGVVCAMIAFIWARQRVAPWEGYQVPRSTFLFIATFVGAVLALQVVAFIFEVTHIIAFSPGIANTAHIMGALTGYLIGRTPLLAWR